MYGTGGSLLVVDDDRHIRESMADYLRDRGHRTETSGTCRGAIDRMGEARFDVVICDVNLPDQNGFELLEWSANHAPETAVIMLTGYGSIESAVEAMRTGAFHYLTKPVIDDELDGTIRRALTRGDRSEDRCEPPAAAGRMIGSDPRMRQLFELIESVADSRSTAMLLGESGTGKTLTARMIHELGPRRDQPFVEVACGALSETLLESELFGHVAGAFTGAAGDRAGRFEQADGGTLFLDEIATASPALQIKLLRVLQDGEFEAVGGTETHQVDVRLIVASNQDLDRLVREDLFREDLYYRINVITITQPPLRERVADIPLLVQFFLDRFAADTNRPHRRFDDEALSRMEGYGWPGNVRELVNVVERAVVLSPRDVIRARDLPDPIRHCAARILPPGQHDSGSLKSALVEPERMLILAALESHGWNRQQAADQLRINRTTLYKKMRRLGISAEHDAR